MQNSTPVAEPSWIVWGFIFNALSTTDFDVFREVLTFPCEFNDEIKEIAKQFSYTYLSYLGAVFPTDLNIPAQPPKNTVEDSDYIQLLDDTFAKLATVTDAAAIYRWGEHIEKQQKQLDKWIFVSALDILLFEWAKYPEKLGYVPPAISPLTQANIQLIVLRHHVEDQRLDLFTIKSARWNDDAWERYIMKKNDAWFMNHTWTQLQLVKWNRIFALLSEEEIHALSEWGNTYAKHYTPNREFTILELREALQKFDAEQP